MNVHFLTNSKSGTKTSTFLFLFFFLSFFFFSLKTLKSSDLGSVFTEALLWVHLVHNTQLDSECCANVRRASTRDFPLQVGCEILFQKPASRIPPSYFRFTSINQENQWKIYWLFHHVANQYWSSKKIFSGILFCNSLTGVHCVAGNSLYNNNSWAPAWLSRSWNTTTPP